MNPRTEQDRDRINLSRTVNICDVFSGTKSSWVSSILDRRITRTNPFSEPGCPHLNRGPNGRSGSDANAPVNRTMRSS
jgi:hypothetical protein